MLRQERGYSSRHVSCPPSRRIFQRLKVVQIYYFAMVTNVLVRWEWIWYLPVAGRYVRLRTYFIALAEMLRRWQWNFFRVETEHLGNADAYRVTREIPLPYRRIEHDSEEDEMGPNRASKRPGSLSIRLEALKREILGRGPKGEGDGNGDGHEPQRHVQRDYEAGQRLDPVVSRTRDGDESEV
ncbi:hypothetical protein BD324DRAFT_10302 [Kockovaella imperatae]|uniref:EXS domain-containing protein n=1 Tax=Kockovaella imperatae TaxID=4999 RepID=A0A1Y1UR84_9TREE|nr:hypothetical protein BD324DRAFT_10302 [Kockovaella imperatae]ORX40588.1 hypothetical protein BD324DRAFT_10302 [Kockovaella imperatae]